MDQTSCPVSPQQWERNLKSNKTTVLCCSIRRPSFSNTGKLQRMERYFAHLALVWQTRWENELYRQARQAFADQTGRDTAPPWQATLDYQITYWNPPLLSIRIDIQEHGPTNPPTLLCIGEVWDCSSGYPCPLHAFLPERTHRWKHPFIKQLQEQAQMRLNSGESLLHPNCLAEIEQTFDTDRFYLTEDGLVIFYPLYSLGAYSEGIPTFTIPLQAQIQSNKFRALSRTAQR